MPSSISSPESAEARPTPLVDWALIAGWVTGPVSFLTALEANYVLSYVACAHGSRWPMHLVTAAAILLSLAAGAWAWRAGADAAATSRRRFMGVAALALGAGFALAIAAMEFPVIALPPCRP
jgi:hypothetical protein